MELTLPHSNPAAPSHPADPAGGAAGLRVLRWAGLASVLSFGALGLWAVTAPLDEGVPAQGSVVVDTKRKAVQHNTGGIVRRVLVSEGMAVKEGQPLYELDDADARANMEMVRQRYFGLRAAEARLVAERDGQTTMQPHPDLQAALSDPQVQTQWLTQQQLLATRRAALQAELAGIEEGIQGQRITQGSLRHMIASRQSQLALLEDELGHTRSLVNDGYAPRNRQLELERQLAELRATMADLQGNLTRADRSVAELEQRSRQRQQEYRKEVATQQADVYREVQADAEKLKALRDELGRTQVRAPAAGQVVGLTVQGVGAVIQPAQKLADVVPQGESLLLEVRVPPHVIDRVRPGQVVDVRFSGFAQTPQLVVDGEVRSVSADSLTDPATQQTYFLARVGLTAAGLKKLGQRQMQPGMTAEAIFRTGERSFLAYLLHPLTRRVAASMTEE
jgi:protease secretion system membrane fusion protein